MKREKESPEKVLEQAVDAIRKDEVSTERIAQAAAQVRLHLEHEYNKVVPHPAVSEVDRIESCEDFRSLIPAYLTASLMSSRRLLLEDHTRECVTCRRALEAARQGGSVVAPGMPVRRSTRSVPRMRWAAPIAAIVVLAVVLETGRVRDWFWPVDAHAMVRTVDGSLFGVTGQESGIVAVGARVESGQSVRTGVSSGAVLELTDGTRIEMGPRAEVSLGRARDGVKISLARGNVIVSAAKQHGHLYVQTGDCLVAVVGTVFSVSAGVKGSRVSVIEGEVQVTEDDGIEQSVSPGEQVYTNPAMGVVPISEEIAWSRDAEALLKELEAFGKDFAKRTENNAMRYSSDLVPLVAADTVVFATLPNVSQSYAESYALFRQRVAENAALSTWWNNLEQSRTGLGLDEIMNRLSEVGAYLGPELILAIPKDENGGNPVFLSSTSRPDTLASALEADLQRVAEIDGHPVVIRIVRDPAALSSLSGSGLVVYIDDQMMIASDAARVRQTLGFRNQPESNLFRETSLYRRLEQAYSEGVGWLVAVDFGQILSNSGDPALAQLGLDNVQQLVMEQKTGMGTAASQITLGFDQERRGVPAWLGTPSAMGSLDFVSPDAYGFSGWVVKDPEKILEDILGFAPEQFASQLNLAQQQFGIDLRRDLLEPLGNEGLVAIDGPILPSPSWKVVVEVKNAARLENTIQWLVTSINREAEARQLPTMKLESETVDGKTYHKVSSESLPTEIHFTSWAGYMIFAPNRALLTQAIQIHDSGNSISRSSAFRSLMPADGRDVASAIMYQNLEALAQSVPSLATDGLIPELRDGLQTARLMQGSLPRLVLGYGERDRILGSAKGSYGIQIAGMFSLQHLIGPTGMMQSIH